MISRHLYADHRVQVPKRSVPVTSVRASAMMWIGESDAWHICTLKQNLALYYFRYPFGYGYIISLSVIFHSS